jgi:hypothetical protein
MIAGSVSFCSTNPKNLVFLASFSARDSHFGCGRQAALGHHLIVPLFQVAKSVDFHPFAFSLLPAPSGPLCFSPRARAFHPFAFSLLPSPSRLRGPRFTLPFAFSLLPSPSGRLCFSRRSPTFPLPNFTT